MIFILHEGINKILNVVTSKKFTITLKLVLMFVAIGLIYAGGMATIKAIDAFLDYNTLEFQNAIVVNAKAQSPIKVVKREELRPVVYVNGKEDLEELVRSFGDKQDIARYICDKFGVANCQTALAVAKAESGLREDAVNLNGGKSLDVGIFQVNSVHWSKQGCSLKELVDARKNIDCAYEIWKAQGFTPWVAYNNGSYLAMLEK